VLIYPKEDLEIIKWNLKNGVLRFVLNGKELAFSKTRGRAAKEALNTTYLIQRNDRAVYAGLAYSPDTEKLIVGYPHIDNPPKSLPTDVFLRNLGEGYAEQKMNGTQIGIERTMNGLIYRTRGTILPNAFFSDINLALVKKATTIVGIQESVFKEFKARYTPIFEEGRADGSIDEMGNVVISKYAPEIVAAVKPLFESQADVVSVKGEFVSRFNPIAVDPLLSSGIYFDVAPYKFVIFEIAAATPDGIKFLAYPEVCRRVSEAGVGKTNDRVSVVKGLQFRETPFEALIDLAGTEEGVVVKTNTFYVKVKKEDVIAFERMLGRASTVLDYSVKHVFEKGLSYSDNQLFDEKVLMDQIELDRINDAVHAEIESSGFGEEELVRFYGTKGLTTEQAKSKIESRIARRVREGLLTIVIPQLIERGVPIQTMYLELPKLIKFDKGVIYFDARRKKFLPTPDYARLLSFVYGITVKKKERMRQ
jgi:hypothetical protein